MPKEINRPVPLHWTPDHVMRFWNGFSQTRLTELGFARTASPSIILAVWPHLAPGGTHFDLGAGDGDLVAELIDNGFRTAAFEPSPGRREVLDGRFRDRQGFLGCIDPDADSTWDVVLVCEVIEHVLEDEFARFLDRLFHLVKPGGRLILTTPNAEDLELNNALCPVCGTLFHRWQHQRSFNVSSLDVLMRETGFETLTLHQIEFRFDLLSPYRDYLQGRAKLPERPPPHTESGALTRMDRMRWRWAAAQRRLKHAYLALRDRDESSFHLPDYVYELIQGRAAYVGAGTQLLYIGRRVC